MYWSSFIFGSFMRLGIEKGIQKLSSSSEGWIIRETHGRKIGSGKPRSLRTYLKPPPPSPVANRKSSYMRSSAPPPLPHWSWRVIDPPGTDHERILWGVVLLQYAWYISIARSECCWLASFPCCYIFINQCRACWCVYLCMYWTDSSAVTEPGHRSNHTSINIRGASDV